MDDQARARARLRHRRPCRLPPQELLLSGQPQGVSDLPIRRASVHKRFFPRPRARRRHVGGDRARASRGGRGEERPHGRRDGTHPRRRPDAGRFQPRRDAAGRDRHPARPPLGRADQALPPAAPADHPGARHFGRRDAGGIDAVRRQRLRPAGGVGRAAHADGAQEHQLVQLRRAGDRARDPAAGRDLRVRRPGRAGDAPFRARTGARGAAPLQGGGAGLPLLPRARSRPDRAAGRDGRRAPARRSSSCRARGSSASRTSSISGSRRSW